MKQPTLLFFFTCLLAFTAAAQQPDITGVWNGELQMTDTAGNPVHLPYEIAVSEEKGKLLGYSRIVFHANGKDEPGIQNIELKWKGKEIVMEDEGFIEHQFSINPSRRVKKTMVVTLRETDREMIMEGTWSTNRTRYYIPAKGTVVLRRKLDFKKSELFKSLDTLKLVSKLSFKDRPELPPVTAMAPAPSAPEPEPELLIPALPRVWAERVTVTVPTRSVARVSPLAAGKKAQLDALARVPMKPAPKPVQPEPVVAAVKAPVKQEPAPAPPEKKPAPQPRPAPAPPVAQAAPAPAPQPEKKPAPPVVTRPVMPQPEIVAPSAVKGAADIDKRVTRTDQSFYFQSDSLVLTLYDNGEVDGDTVTVLMNGGVLFSKAGLDIRPNTKTIYITPNMDSVKLVMYAESLGEIPPNTGLLIVNDGDKRYEVRFSADLKTNAGIVLRRRKEE